MFRPDCSAIGGKLLSQQLLVGVARDRDIIFPKNLEILILGADDDATHIFFVAVVKFRPQRFFFAGIV